MGVPYTAGFVPYLQGVTSAQEAERKATAARLKALTGAATAQNATVRNALMPAQTSALAGVRGTQGALSSALGNTMSLADRAKRNQAAAGTFGPSDFTEVGSTFSQVGDVLGTPFALGEKVSSGIGDLLGTNSALDREKARAYIDSYNANFGGHIQPQEFNTGNETIDAIRDFNRSDSADLAYGVQQIDAIRQQHKDSLAALESAARASNSAASGAGQISAAITATNAGDLDAEESRQRIKKLVAERQGTEVGIPGKIGEAYKQQMLAGVLREDGRTPGEFADDENNEAITKIRRVEALSNALNEKNDLPLAVRAALENELSQNTGIALDSTVRPRTKTSGYNEVDEALQSIADFIPLVPSEGLFEDTIQRDVAPGNLTGQEAAEFGLAPEELEEAKSYAGINYLFVKGKITRSQAQQLAARVDEELAAPAE
tara:strand:+ start:2816 stop:4111 length:1296 start_codon:yes stop_codon:yes gene_type:complete